MRGPSIPYSFGLIVLSVQGLSQVAQIVFGRAGEGLFAEPVCRRCDEPKPPTRFYPN